MSTFAFPKFIFYHRNFGGMAESVKLSRGAIQEITQLGKASGIRHVLQVSRSLAAFVRGPSAAFGVWRMFACLRMRERLHRPCDCAVAASSGC